VITAALHVVGVILAVTVPWQAPRQPRYIVLEPIDTVAFMPFQDTPTHRTRGPRVGTARPEPPPETPLPPPPPPPAAAQPSDSGTAMPAYDPNANALTPRVGDGRLWVSPRPALPSTVAEALYGDTVGRNERAVERLRAMMDSLNQIYDEEQREHRRPSWTTDVGGRTFGIDSQYIHIAGIKIPTAVLALLPLNMPQGNFDEGLRARHLEEMRQDIMRSAARAQTYQDFRRYVRELRARTDAEREFQRRQKQPADTVKAIP